MADGRRFFYFCTETSREEQVTVDKPENEIGAILPDEKASQI